MALRGGPLGRVSWHAPADLVIHFGEVMTNPSRVKKPDQSGPAYLGEDCESVVIRGPMHPDMATVSRAVDVDEIWLSLT